MKRITSLADIEFNEATPLSDRNLANNTYEVFERSQKQHGDKIGLRFLFAGTADEASFDYSYNDLLARITQAANAFQKLGVGQIDWYANSLSGYASCDCR